MSENPYSPPRSDENSGAGIFDRHALVDIVKGWEKLRIAYNLFMGALVVGVPLFIIVFFGVAWFGIGAPLDPGFP